MIKFSIEKENKIKQYTSLYTYSIYTQEVILNLIF